MTSQRQTGFDCIRPGPQGLAVHDPTTVPQPPKFRLYRLYRLFGVGNLNQDSARVSRFGMEFERCGSLHIRSVGPRRSACAGFDRAVALKRPAPRWS